MLDDRPTPTAMPATGLLPLSHRNNSETLVGQRRIPLPLVHPLPPPPSILTIFLTIDMYPLLPVEPGDIRLLRG